MSSINVNAISNEAGTGAPNFPNGLSVNSNPLPTAGSLSNRNRIINGAMVIDQRNAGASVVGSGGARVYPVDRFALDCAGGGAITASRSTTAPSGFTNSIGFTVTTPDASIAASDLYYVLQVVEGFNAADFGWGTSGAQSATLSFWARSSLTGTFSGGILNDGGTRSYVFAYTINAANTWEFKTVSIPAVTSGTWNTSNGVGVIAVWDFGSGSNFQDTAGTWLSSAASKFKTAGSVNLISTNGATFYITGVQLEVGDTATPFEHRPYGQELALCQRYYQLIASGVSGLIGVGWFWTSTVGDVYIPFKITMRSAPTLIQSTGSNYFNLQALSTAFNFSGFAGVDMASADGVALYATGLAAGTVGATGYMYTLNAAAMLAMSSEL